MSELIWETPSDTGSNRTETWKRIAEALRAKPGEWAVVATKKSSGAAAVTASNIKRSKMAAFRDGIYEATTRAAGKGEYKVYARFMEGE